MVAELRHVSHHYGSVAALTDVSLSLHPGAVTALLGPNGAGKTTAVSLLTGLARPTSGQARLFGGDPQSLAEGRAVASAGRRDPPGAQWGPCGRSRTGQ